MQEHIARKNFIQAKYFFYMLQSIKTSRANRKLLKSPTNMTTTAKHWPRLLASYLIDCSHIESCFIYAVCSFFK